jgi:glutamine synthetase
MSSKICIEYIWLDGKKQFRSKTKVIEKKIHNISEISKWNYDGSSTYQASGSDSEIIIEPCKLYNDPFRGGNHKLVFCDTYLPNGTPHSSNTRFNAHKIFQKDLDQEPWFGLEQEYFIIDNNTHKPLGFPMHGVPDIQGKYYCSIGTNKNFGRQIVEEHLTCCIEAGIKISGINAEVAPGQWEFQIGPCEGIDQGDDLWMARYLLERISEKYNVYIDYEPKPIEGDWNGSGCHTNFSTKNMRNGTNTNNGLYYIELAIDKLSLKHDEHMKLYGSNNDKRMTGLHETASFDVFTKGIANRGASIRIGNENYNNKCGYFEDRRPSSNCDPYLVTSKIFETCCL